MLVVAERQSLRPYGCGRHQPDANALKLPLLPPVAHCSAPVYAQNGQQNRQAQTLQAQSGQAAHGYGVYSTQSGRGTWLFAPNPNSGSNS